jgi:hypothetical protein
MDLIYQEISLETSLALSQETSDHLSQALGETVLRIWGYLPRDVQCRLFNETLNSQHRRMRPQLASLLHGKHPRTSGARQARAMLEPDSLGG